MRAKCQLYERQVFAAVKKTDLQLEFRSGTAPDQCPRLRAGRPACRIFAQAVSALRFAGTCRGDFIQNALVNVVIPMKMRSG